MKKFFMMFMALMTCCISVSAQDEGEEEDEIDSTFDFCYADGTVIPNGSTVVFTNASVDPDDGTALIHAPLYVKANTEEGGFVGIKCDVSDMTTGAFKICFPETCIQEEVPEEGVAYSFTVNTEAGGASSGSNDPFTSSIGPRDLETAWLNIANYATCRVDYQIQPYSQVETKYGISYISLGAGSKITVYYQYADPMAVKGVTDNTEAKVVSIHTAGGQQVQSLVKGINIVRYDNGKTVKVMGR